MDINNKIITVGFIDIRVSNGSKLIKILVCSWRKKLLIFALSMILLEKKKYWENTCSLESFSQTLLSIKMKICEFSSAYIVNNSIKFPIQLS